MKTFQNGLQSIMNLNEHAEKWRSNLLKVAAVVVFALFLGWATSKIGIATPVLLIALAVLLPLSVYIGYRPVAGLRLFIVYSFFITAFGRYIADLPFVYGVEFILLVSWIGVLFHANRYKWSLLNRDIVWMGIIWFGITVFELGNPEAGSFLGWISDARYSFLWILCVPLGFLLLRSKKALNYFLITILICSSLVALYGIIQLKIGLSSADAAFLAAGGSKTHIINGQLRVFSLYSDAGQFGASMAQMAVISLTLALGPFSRGKKFLLFIAALLFTYGMLISGTRGALFVFLVGLLMALIIYKNLKVFLIVLFILAGSIAFLKYTTILQSNPEIRRMRTALNPNDPSFKVRLQNQQTIRHYLKDKPFGAGIGSIGYAGYTYNKGTYISTIPPDSYWVKVWVMYGIAGFAIWFGFLFYIIGKSSAIVWYTTDSKLRFKLGALAAGATGIFVSSYGNEVMNNMPSAMILYISWVLIFIHSSSNRLNSQKVSQ
ncbi:MAG: O-antigen ligase family protein [Candidatus Dadabacteria bacterium]